MKKHGPIQWQKKIAWLHVYARPANANHNKVEDSLSLQQQIVCNTHNNEHPAASGFVPNKCVHRIPKAQKCCEMTIQVPHINPSISTHKQHESSKMHRPSSIHITLRSVSIIKDLEGVACASDPVSPQAAPATLATLSAGNVASPATSTPCNWRLITAWYWILKARHNGAVFKFVPLVLVIIKIVCWKIGVYIIVEVLIDAWNQRA
jgi:hypothetical protein